MEEVHVLGSGKSAAFGEQVALKCKACGVCRKARDSCREATIGKSDIHS